MPWVTRQESLPSVPSTLASAPGDWVMCHHSAPFKCRESIGSSNQLGAHRGKLRRCPSSFLLKPGFSVIDHSKTKDWRRMFQLGTSLHLLEISDFSTKLPLQRLLCHLRWHIPDLNKSKVKLWLGGTALGALFQMAKVGSSTLLATPDWLDISTLLGFCQSPEEFQSNQPKGRGRGEYVILATPLKATPFDT